MKNISMRTRGFDILFTTIILMVILGLSSCPPPFTEDMYAFVKDTAGFTATPGNHKATLDWVVDPFAESYSIYYTTNGMQPSENYGYKIRNVEPPYVLTGLENGCMHVFQSRAHYSNAEDSVSDYVKAIPLSDTMLTPKATGGYEQIKVEWDSIPGITAYEVYRSLNEKGNYTNITGWLYSSSFIDTQVINGQKYFYKVKPGMEDGILSSASSGETYKFPERDQRKWEIGSCYVPVAAHMLMWGMPYPGSVSSTYPMYPHRLHLKRSAITTHPVRRPELLSAVPTPMWQTVQLEDYVSSISGLLIESESQKIDDQQPNNEHYFINTFHDAQFYSRSTGL